LFIRSPKWASCANEFDERNLLPFVVDQQVITGAQAPYSLLEL
jgi:hypothetical protein